jgi:uncharacterized membrane protein
MAAYSVRVREDIARWVEQGLLPAALAETLSRDVEQRDRKSFSFGSVLAMMAALLLAAAILVLIAANWEAIPRIVRVGALFAVILAGYVGGAILKSRDQNAIGEALYIIAAAAFGGSIALIGQMYHMSGNESDALLTWCIGTGVAALALRSNPLTVAAVTLAAGWMFLRGGGYWTDTSFPHLFLLLAALLWLVSYWTDSMPARHLLLLSLIFYAAMFIASGGVNVVLFASLLAVVSASLFATAVLAPDPIEKIVRLDGRFAAHCLIGFLVGIGMAEIELMDHGQTAELVVLALAGFGGIAAAIVFAGRESRGLRWIAYTGFSLQLAFVYTVTMGTMLGTAGLFFASGAVLGLIAFLIIRIEKRMNAAPAIEGAAA